MTDAQLVDYFKEHALYELLMLRYANKRLQSCNDQLLWNAMFAAFNVSARNIYEFFFSKDNRNVSFKDFAPHYLAFEPNDKDQVSGTLDKLHRQCFHLGKAREQASPQKVNLDRINSVCTWADATMVRFIGCLDFRQSIDLQKVDLEKRNQTPAMMLRTSSLVSTTSSPVSISTTFHGKAES